MSESTCLHIQGRESGPIRVVELPWISVRIGRAPYCEVRLSEHDLAEEACRLQKRGRSWYLVPVASQSLTSLDGRPVDGSCLLPFDVPFFVGHYCLTLRRDRTAEPDWEMYQVPSPPRIEHFSPPLDVRLAVFPDRPVPRMDEQRPASAEARPARLPGRTAPPSNRRPHPASRIAGTRGGEPSEPN